MWFRTKRVFLRRESRLVKLGNKATLSRPRHRKERKGKGGGGGELGIKKKKGGIKADMVYRPPGPVFPDGGEIGGVKCASCYGWEIKQLIR